MWASRKQRRSQITLWGEEFVSILCGNKWDHGEPNNLCVKIVWDFWFLILNSTFYRVREKYPSMKEYYVYFTVPVLICPELFCGVHRKFRWQHSFYCMKYETMHTLPLHMQFWIWTCVQVLKWNKLKIKAQYEEISCCSQWMGNNGSMNYRPVLGMFCCDNH